MSNDFIQNAVNALYQSNELMALKGELANLKAERDQLKADLEKSDGVVWTLSVENARLKAEVERLKKYNEEAMAHIAKEGRGVVVLLNARNPTQALGADELGKIDAALQRLLVSKGKQRTERR